MTKTTTIILLLTCMLSTSVSAQTFTEEININCGDTAYVVGLGYPTWQIPEITRLPQYGHAILLGDLIPANLLQYQAPHFFAGEDTVVIRCAHATQITCDTGIYVFHVGCSTVYSPVYPVLVPCNDTTIIGGLNAVSFPHIVQTAQHGIAKVEIGANDGAWIVYIPEPGFEGLDYILVRLLNSGGLDTVNYELQVYCNGISGTSHATSIRPVTFFPQPSAGVVYATGISGTITGVNLTDGTGKKYCVSFVNVFDRLMLDITPLPTGVYGAAVTTTEGRVWTGKIVKVR